MQNKPNVKYAKIHISSFTAGCYVFWTLGGTGQNKPNSKPNEHDFEMIRVPCNKINPAGHIDSPTDRCYCLNIYERPIFNRIMLKY
jgi:hypothetical protein